MLANLCTVQLEGHKLTNGVLNGTVCSEGRSLRSRSNKRNGNLTCKFGCCNDLEEKARIKPLTQTGKTQQAKPKLNDQNLKQTVLNQIFTNVKGSQQTRGKLTLSAKCFPSKDAKVEVISKDENHLDEKMVSINERSLSASPKKVGPPQDSSTISPSTAHKIYVVDVEREAKQKKVLTPSTSSSNLKIQPKKDLVKSKNRRKLKLGDSIGSHKLTEYYPIRRSERKPKNIITEIEKYNLEQAVLSGKEDGVKVELFPEKGRGVVTTRYFKKGEFVLEYAGDLIDIVEAKRREAVYSQDQNLGSFMYYFQYKNVSYCIDATAECPRLGRLVNHSRNGNLATRILEIKNEPRLILITKRDIELGEEILYDYGDRSKEALANHPWLAF
ncbi:N-lysine methyltransferase KMT5A-B-like isoform X2 [Artemia franciscana]|uniref:[histone H4]-lysine(20) N-methyltransferase n=1 Tax=Artemia franciscana TaxID=6661 RepID=A0AA88L020_ARTSF|nr:hypothetical protein QYM36_014221 [Artemia franciscana]KAK2708540.1 hypothetical protein QYM36_014221 [Artemia franciscana]